MPVYTVFCQEKGNQDTTHISAVTAENVEQAIVLGREECCDDWSSPSRRFDLDKIHCLGVAEGDVTILHWEDQAG